MSENLPHIKIYTDGGADPNPGPGGWGAVLIHPERTRELSGGDPDTTNNRMELTAVIEALRALKVPCAIDLYTDSQYVKRGIGEWIDKWMAKNWKGVANADLWQTLHRLAQEHRINWHWVKGHAGDKYNERADALASAAIPRTARTLDPNATRVVLRIAGPKQGKGAGGWAAAIRHDDVVEELYGGHPDTTANHLVIYAVLEVLAQLPADAPVQLYTNNSYLYDGITKWVKGWRKNGWVKKTDRQPVKFRAAWQRLDQINRTREITWVRFKDDPPPEFDALRRLVELGRSAAARA